VISTTLQPLYPRVRPSTHCTGGWVGPRAGLDVCEKSRPHRDSIPRPSSPKSVAIPTELPGPQKGIKRILNNKTKRDLTLPSQYIYIYSVLIFVVNNRDLLSLNSEIHNLNTRYKNNLHLPSTNLTTVQKGVLYSGSIFINYLPLQIKSLSADLKSL
jgi:hypothetical protein